MSDERDEGVPVGEPTRRAFEERPELFRSEPAHPISGQCMRCGETYFDLRSIGSRCRIDDCGGYITGRTRDELDQQQEEGER